MSHDIGRAEGPSMFSPNAIFQRTEGTDFIHSSRNTYYNKVVVYLTGREEGVENLPDPIDTINSTISTVLNVTSRNQSQHEVEETTGIDSNSAPPQPIMAIRQNQSQPEVGDTTRVDSSSPLPQAMPTDRASRSSEHDAVNVNSIRSSEVLPTASSLRTVAEKYTRTMLKCLAGYPLYEPAPFSELSQTYLHEGIRAGDVGFIREDGTFDFLFNIRPSQNDEINPAHFQSPILQESDDSGVSHKIWHPTRFFHDPVKEKRRLGCTKYICSEPEGAILELPEGATRFEVINRLPFKELAIRCGVEWYKDTMARGRDITNGSLYLVTSYTKCVHWGIAVVKQPCASREGVRFVHNKRIFGKPSPKYNWKGSNSAFTTVAATPDGNVLNQCVFLGGYKIRLREDIWKGLVKERRHGNIHMPITSSSPHQTGNAEAPRNQDHHRQREIENGTKPGPRTGEPATDADRHSGEPTNPTKVPPVTESDEITDLDQPSVHPSRNQDQHPQQEIGSATRPGPRTSEPATDADRHSGEPTNPDLPTMVPPVTESDEIILHADFDPPPVHPSDLINTALLSQEPGAKIAITHDDAWCNLLRDIFLNQKSLDLAKIAQSYTSLIDKYGCISFEKASDSRSCSEVEIRPPFQSTGFPTSQELNRDQGPASFDKDHRIHHAGQEGTGQSSTTTTPITFHKVHDESSPPRQESDSPTPRKSVEDRPSTKAPAEDDTSFALPAVDEHVRPLQDQETEYPALHGTHDPVGQQDPTADSQDHTHTSVSQIASPIVLPALPVICDSKVTSRPEMPPRQRNPFNGREKSLVIAIDIGTTFSGVSYALLEPDKVPQIQSVARFAGQKEQQGASKVPSVVCYDQSGNVVATGSETDLEMNPALSDINGVMRVERFKLHLRPSHLDADKRTEIEKLWSPPEPADEELDDYEEYLAESEDEDTILLDITGIGQKVVEPELQLWKTKQPLPLNYRFKTPVHVFADLLRYLFKSAKEYIIEAERNQDPTFSWASIERNTYFVLTHPNRWEGMQRSHMRKAALEAGLVDESAATERITFVTEGEASLHFCLDKKPDLHEENAGFLVADCGGGTIDLSAYSQTGQGSFKEIASPGCFLQGSIFVTSRARDYFKRRFKDSKFGSDDDIEAMAQAFDKADGAKSMFSDPEIPYYIKFGSVRDMDEEFGISGGRFSMEGSQVAEFFEPAVQDIINGVEEQCDRAKAGTPIKILLLVGGFARSDYLYRRLNDHIRTSGIVVFRPNATDLYKTVADGAVSYYLDHY